MRRTTWFNTAIFLWVPGTLIFLELFVSPLSLISSQRATQCFERASMLAQEDKLEEAVREYLLGIKNCRTNSRAYNNLGVLYFKEHELHKALFAFKQAHRLDPSDAAICFNLGLALYQEDQPAAAIPVLDKGEKDPNHIADSHYLLGACYFDLSEWKSALHELELARALEPRNPQVLFLLFNLYRKTDDSKRALEVATLLFQTHPNSFLVHMLLGEASDSEGRFSSAARQFTKAVGENPHAPILHFMLGYLYWRWKQFGKAVEPLREEIQINPKFAPSYFYLGDIALKRHRTAKAIDLFKNALKLDASYGNAYLGIGEAYSIEGRYAAALPFLYHAARLLPTRPGPHYWLGRTLIKLGNQSEGQKQFEKVNEINAKEQKRARDLLNHPFRSTRTKAYSRTHH